MTGRVVTLGNAVVDLVAAVPALPARGGDVVATDGGLVAGGGGLRVVLAVRGTGGAAAFAGRIGSGPLARTVGAALEAAGVPVLTAPVPDRDTGVAVTLVEPDGERTFVTLPGAELADPTLDDVRFQGDDLVHVSGYGLQSPSRTAAIARVLAALPPGIGVLLDPGPLGVLGDAGAVLSRVDWWSGTAVEAATATGLVDPAGAATALAARVRRGALVRRGPAGCLLALPGADPIDIPAPRVAVRSTNGAGDTHVGAFLAALATGVDPLAAASSANAAAAAFVSR